MSFCPSFCPPSDQALSSGQPSSPQKTNPLLLHLPEVGYFPANLIPNEPSAIILDSNGNYIVALERCIWRIETGSTPPSPPDLPSPPSSCFTSSYHVTMLCGSINRAGSADGIGLEARFVSIVSMCLSLCGKFVYIADEGASVVKKLELATLRVKTISGVYGSRATAKDLRLQNSPDVPFIAGPSGVEVLPSGDILISDGPTIKHLSQSEKAVSAVFVSPDAQFFSEIRYRAPYLLIVNRNEVLSIKCLVEEGIVTMTGMNLFRLWRKFLAKTMFVSGCRRIHMADGIIGGIALGSIRNDHFYVADNVLLGIVDVVSEDEVTPTAGSSLSSREAATIGASYSLRSTIAGGERITGSDDGKKATFAHINSLHLDSKSMSLLACDGNLLRRVSLKTRMARFSLID